MKKRLLCILLAILMVFTTLPISALAETVSQQADPSGQITSAPSEEETCNHDEHCQHEATAQNMTEAQEEKSKDVMESAEEKQDEVLAMTTEEENEFPSPVITDTADGVSPTHAFDMDDGRCTDPDCNVVFSMDDYEYGKAGYDKKLSFPGADRVLINFRSINTALDYVRIYDGSNTEVGKASGLWSSFGREIIVEGDTVRIVYAQGSGDFRIRVIVPMYGHNFEYIPPGCVDGHTLWSYCGVTAKTDIELGSGSGHAFDRNGICMNCGTEFSVDEYDQWDKGYSKTVSFPGAEKVYIYVKGTFYENADLLFYDKNGKMVGTAINDISCTIEGDELKIVFAGENPGDRINVDSVTLMPMYKDNFVTVPPTCTEDGYSGWTYCGTLFKTGTIGKTHIFNQIGKCLRCGAQFSLNDYKKEPPFYITITYPKAESVTISFNMSLSYGADIYDQNGNKVGMATPSGGSMYQFTVPGTQVRINSSRGSGSITLLSVQPNYPASITISTADEWIDFIKDITNGYTYANQTVNLDADIDLSGVDYDTIWDPDANDMAFCGHFKGNGHTISGISETTEKNGGLFRTLGDGAVIEDLTIKDPQIQSIGSNMSCGALAGVSKGKISIDNVHISGGSVTGLDATGGILGQATSNITITNSSNAAAITSKGHYAGGILGRSEDGLIDLSNSSNSGRIHSSGYAGGIAGVLGNNDSSQTYMAKNCTNSGDVTGNFDIGGIIGRVNSTSRDHDFSECSNSGWIDYAKNNNDYSAGGIIGLSFGGGNMQNCTNSGIIKAISYGGGILGRNMGQPMDFSNSVNSTRVYSHVYAGGIAGLLEQTAPDGTYIGKNCLNEDIIESDGYAGGIVGAAYGNKITLDFTQCTNIGIIIGARSGSDYAVGGIIGVIFGGSTDVSYGRNIGTIRGNGSWINQIVGYYTGTLKADNCEEGGSVVYLSALSEDEKRTPQPDPNALYEENAPEKPSADPKNTKEEGTKTVAANTGITGDNTDLLMLIALIALAMAGSGLVLIRRRTDKTDA